MTAVPTGFCSSETGTCTHAYISLSITGWSETKLFYLIPITQYIHIYTIYTLRSVVKMCESAYRQFFSLKAAQALGKHCICPLNLDQKNKQSWQADLKQHKCILYLNCVSNRKSWMKEILKKGCIYAKHVCNISLSYLQSIWTRGSAFNVKMHDGRILRDLPSSKGLMTCVVRAEGCACYTRDGRCGFCRLLHWQLLKRCIFIRGRVGWRSRHWSQHGRNTGTQTNQKTQQDQKRAKYLCLQAKTLLSVGMLLFVLWCSQTKYTKPEHQIQSFELSMAYWYILNHLCKNCMPNNLNFSMQYNTIIYLINTKYGLYIYNMVSRSWAYSPMTQS